MLSNIPVLTIFVSYCIILYRYKLIFLYFVGKRQFAGEVGRSSHEQDRSVGKGEGDDRQGFRSEEGA